MNSKEAKREFGFLMAIMAPLAAKEYQGGAWPMLEARMKILYEWFNHHIEGEQESDVGNSSSL